MERLDHFMARANAAYYATHDPYRDFTTSPEISQVFGEILGLWAAVTWELMGRPDPVLLVEAGPGRGTLMADALRAIREVATGFQAALRLHLIETSPRLRAVQAERLPDATWHDDLGTLPDGPLLLVGNEFLDALPIRQFARREGMWVERFVDGGRFVECPARPPPPAPLPQGEGEQMFPPPLLARGDWGEGAAGRTTFELNEPALAMARSLGSRLSTHAGAALFLDYGPEHSANGDSLQAVGDGHPTDPLAPPGTADLTAHVDFAAFAAAARDAGAAIHGPVPQGLFLARLGLFQRTDRLARTQPPARASALIEAARRLAEPNRMGRLFKALALCSPTCPPPPGFEG
jgi:SAM-dependent MidA family methyltransferase